MVTNGERGGNMGGAGGTNYCLEDRLEGCIVQYIHRQYFEITINGT